MILGHPFVDLVRAAHDWCLVDLIGLLLRGSRRQHRHVRTARVNEERDEGVLEAHARSEFVHHVGARVAGQLRQSRASLEVGIHHAIQVPFHRGRVERRAVLERNVVAKLKRERSGVVGDFVRLCQPRLNLAVLVDIQQCLANR